MFVPCLCTIHCCLNKYTFSQCNMVNAAVKCANKDFTPIAFLKKIAQLGSCIAHIKDRLPILVHE
jgi:hypothetical protein